MSTQSPNLAFWQSEKPFQQLVLQINNSRSSQLRGLVSVATASLLKALHEQFPDRPILFISTGEQSGALHKLENQLNRLSTQVASTKTPSGQPEYEVQVLPVSQVSPFEGLFESEGHYAQISKILGSWLAGKNGITLCNAKSITQAVCPVQDFIEKEIKLQVRQETNLTTLLKTLVELGYKRVDTVFEVGQFAVRGEILDVFPADLVGELPLRISFFGDEIESIKSFEPWSQRSLSSKAMQAAVISPLRPFVLPTADVKTELIGKLKALISELDEMQSYFWQEDLKKFELDDFESGEWQRFLPWIHEQFALPLSYFPKNGLIVIEETFHLESKPQQLVDRLWNEAVHKLERKALPPSQKDKLSKFVELPLQLHHELSERLKIEISSMEVPQTGQRLEGIDLDCSLVPQFRANIDELEKFIESHQLTGKTIWLSVGEDSQKQLQSEFANTSINCDSLKFVLPFGLDRGFSFSNNFLLTDFELFNKKAVLGVSKKALIKPEDFIPIDLDAIRPGDFVVHLKHGIGRFLKMKIIELEGKKREYITLEYLNGDLLNVPVDQMNLLTLYKGSSEGQSVKLSRLGGVDWEKTKNQVRASVKKVAHDLLELYAKRSVKDGFNFGPDTPWQIELEDSFPYKETPDQLKAINEIKADMESGRIMDRLLCGDVGYGKTEVIIRAAFKAIMAGKQVALMAPTTILAQQHFKSFKERFGKFPTKIDLITRANLGKDKKEIFKRIEEGHSDLVIGTHAILSKSLSFKDLGLIMVDEEQKFGVNHKEKLKALKENVSVLTVSATPIPRTMHMALSGIREMSLISTAPPGRVPIKTQIAVHNPKLIRAAIVRELERGGQVFYLHNRVESIQNKAIELMTLVPEATFRIAHGQMNEKEITEAMEGFINHEYDVLIATSIIENGLDIPNANTMVIENADKFGLAQLYQLRGRVGRSNDPSRPGFALLMHSHHEKLNEQAKARLETIARYSHLGSGYQIALRDMEIRGVGNLLGAEQHGKMVSVGFELYCEMLNEAIMEMKLSLSSDDDQQSALSVSKARTSILQLEEKPVFDFKVNAYIPIDWIRDDLQRVKEYQRLSEVQSLLQLNGLGEEWKDRFGELPEPVKELMKIVRLRLLASEVGVFGLVRPIGNFIELNCRISFELWRKLQSKLPQWLKDKLAIKFQENSYAKIMLRIDELETVYQLSVLEDLLLGMKDLD